MLLTGYLVSLLCYTVTWNWSSATQVLRPRGVALQKKIFYDPSKDFNCLDGSLKIPFVFVNDDYCDCADGSDEPGTPACPNGVFHCSNLGYQTWDIPSSRVNDGICDCCDGSDEYNSTINCVDNCSELGKEALEAARRLKELFSEGSKIRLNLIKDAKSKAEEDERRLEEFRKEMEKVENTKKEKEAIKKQAEEEEKAALDKFRAEADAQRKAQEEAEMIKIEEKEKLMAEAAFKELDKNSDGILSYQEVQQFIKFDQNNDGVVDPDEAKFFLHMKEEMSLDEFTTTGWIIMKPFYLKDKTPEPLQNDQAPSEQDADGDVEVEHPSYESDGETEDDVEDSSNNAEGEGEGEDEDHGPPYHSPKRPRPDTTVTEAPLPEYDAETLAIIEKAKQAKQEYSDAESKFLSLNNQIREIEASLEMDYGPEREFATLHGQCFEFSDREYIYKFCPFNTATQRSKSGGGETNLGTWGDWTGGDSDRYSRMRYENGVQCWNGPARSVEVYLKCGLNNALLSTSEPSRCEYRFEFETPALCRPENQSNSHEHTEL
ncbi:glucosidase 2 subunit beta [Tetranychus urticae]|uniref:Glucosidase 2 subunit beta n=1 Tax=Tetranychus urticae TaxID=32264 RepID=T1K6V8_TETUR|nr:glucosidase 2 subunit beta [Tetranychus urticae]